MNRRETFNVHALDREFLIQGKYEGVKKCQRADEAREKIQNTHESEMGRGKVANLSDKLSWSFESVRNLATKEKENIIY